MCHFHVSSSHFSFVVQLQLFFVLLIREILTANGEFLFEMKTTIQPNQNMGNFQLQFSHNATIILVKGRINFFRLDYLDMAYLTMTNLIENRLVKSLMK